MKTNLDDDEADTVLNSAKECNISYKQMIINFKKMKVNIELNLIYKKIEEYRKFYEQSNNFLYDSAKAKQLAKEINDELNNKQNEKSTINDYTDLTLEFNEIKSQYNTDDKSDKQYIETKNKYDRLKDKIKELSIKTEKISYKLKDFFKEIFNPKSEQIKEENKISNEILQEKITKLSKEQNQTQKITFFSWFFNLTIFAIFFYYFFKSRKII
ncbi:MAG: hypothetical protein Q8781_00740 [Candidatus Phytoplasma stylosanthis]|uniref:hypothetical protein n=1 Tax=Candidatus Phytoplasma stylosanthis TaxID=2798314 RepID=UPI00293A2B08|nr:hypothetical protein [Candidatus Phytoplasma stylosanthis]MDV3170815.1 hypothetical protein [Candidatus Phytoplasma stylosanthis]MDV3174171.1 hypothetical protein [Candidatus Phytoplasma stylosanthis]MDV3202538.1 hypothetical protein [Candidatus Phytoplasma stylosanthis]